MKDVVAKVLEVARRESSPRVIRVRVRLGALSHFTPSHFVEHFRESTRGTLAEGAEVDIDVSDDRLDPLAGEVVLESVVVQER
jgi:hydrogenase nickel incorporation protein HypA/HybF